MQKPSLKRGARFGLLALLINAIASAAHAACPMALAVYGARDDVAGIDFRPNGSSVTVTNTFRMWAGNGVLFDGIVMWTEEPSRSVGMLRHKCPDGDVTGEELAACTLWQGVIYAVDGKGTVGMVPRHDEPAPEKLVLTDLGPALAQSTVFGTNGFDKAPWDVFELKGCQE